MKQLFVLWFLYAGVGFTAESTWTGLRDPVVAWWKGKKIDWTLPCRVNLWIIMVYGVSAAISYSLIAAYAPWYFGWHWAVRGLGYVVGFWLWEFAWGFGLDLFGALSWRYNESSEYRIWHYVSPWHAPLWFILGLAFQEIQSTILPRILHG